jgi:hypothetical protein
MIVALTDFFLERRRGRILICRRKCSKVDRPAFALVKLTPSVSKPAISAQPPEIKWYPDDQPEYHDCNGDLKPDNSAQLSEHNLKPRPPRFWHVVGDGLDQVRHEAQRLADPLRMETKAAKISAHVAIIVVKRKVCALASWPMVGRLGIRADSIKSQRINAAFDPLDRVRKNL